MSTGKYKNIREGDYDSLAEKNYGRDVLEPLRLAGEIRRWKHHVNYKIYVNGVYICYLEVDYEVENKHSNIEIHEVKGVSTADWVLKKKLFKACYPSIPYYVIREKKIRDFKGRKKSYFKRDKPSIIQLDPDWKEEHAQQKKKMDSIIGRRRLR